MLTVTPLGPLLRRRTATWLAMRQVHGVARTASLRVRDRQGPLAPSGLAGADGQSSERPAARRFASGEA